MSPSDCAFCAIAAGAAEGEVVFEGEQTIAFLDTRPLFPGHVLLVPRDHYVTIEDLPAEQIGGLFADAQALAPAVRKACGAQGTFIAANNGVSQSVPHLHVHVVPRTKGDGLRGFFWPRKPYEDADHMARVGAAIRKQLER